MDIGRVDASVRGSPARLTAYREAVAATSPFPVGTRLRLRGTWGISQVEIAGYDIWNGRIVATVRGDSIVDSLAQRAEPFVVSVATQWDSTAVDSVPNCTRDTLTTQLSMRADVVRDSLEQVLRASAMPRFARLVPGVVVKSSRASGCFGPARVALVVSLRSKGLEWVQERFVLIDTTGRAIPVRADDMRLKAHDIIAAFDADGDGVDDLAMRGLRELAGGTSILRYDVKARRFDRLASGFAWEER